MKPLYKGLAIAALHSALILSVAGKYAYDRATLPRVWCRALPVDPNLPVRGRYLSMRLEDRDGGLVAFFLPEHAPDPTIRVPGEQLWVEVSLPHKGSPRPIRLGVKKDGVITPLPLD